MKLTFCILALLMLIGVAVGFQSPAPIPPFEGDGNPQHDGQPKWCSNVDTKTHAKNCDCQPKMGDKECHEPNAGGGENSRCSVYCRKAACRCESTCQKTE